MHPLDRELADVALPSRIWIARSVAQTATSPAQQAGARNEVDVGRVRSAQAVLLHLGALLAALGAGRDHERRVPARAQLAVDRGDHHVDVAAMPPLVAQAFCPFDTHSSLASSYLAVVRIDEQNAATLGSSAAPKHCGTHDRHADPGIAPEQLLIGGLLDHRPGGLLALVSFRGRSRTTPLGPTRNRVVLAPL